MSIEVIGVVGAGQMGRGIAQVAAEAGLTAHLLDVDMATAENGVEQVARTLSRRVEKGELSADARTAILSRVRPTGDYASFADAQMVIEAATERFELKAELFRRMDEAAPEGAILASNTSSISITKLAACTTRPELVVGMHFMNPVPVMKLVELIRALQTSEATFAATRALAERLGKTVITSLDRPGFIVNRMLIPFINEACFVLEEGIGTPEEIDAGAKLGLNHPLGPLALADLIGLDTCLAIAEVLHSQLGDDKYRPAPILRNYVAAGWLGRKTRRGFHDYSERR
ncbi:MAG: 3-hydroxybutyryl-CoA dehydrogenase [Sandaracinaceae bacterium]|nr:3-hydroxybutyryl-CoA dehydrogenase [Sandaracinaceae bacterium]